MNEKIMPILFVGHGTPMNAIEVNEYSKKWVELGKSLPHPKAIVSISAHRYNGGERISRGPSLKMIYDMYGFPDELYEVTYPAKGSPKLTDEILAKIGDKVKVDNSWGIDHGVRSVLRWMYPEADIPLAMLSVDGDMSFKEAFEFGKKLRFLREEGVLVLASGNVVHNLNLIDRRAKKPFPRAEKFDSYIKNAIVERRFDDVIDYKKAGESSRLAFFYPDHFYPLVYLLGLVEEEDKLAIFNESFVYGSLSMTSYLFYRD
jgi:4,5-DOPA dioxygenase extradiol